MKKHKLACAALAASAFVSPAAVIDLDDLAVPVAGYENGEHLAGGFTSGGASFNNFYDDTFGPYWEGFAYSTLGDVMTAGFGNQYSAYAGGGSDPNGQAVPGNVFALGFVGFTIPTITLPPALSRPLSLRVTNTTYAALSMRNGDAFAKRFGGVSGNDPDFFKLTITALDAAAAPIGSLDFFLADYRFADNAQDYILNSWAEVDLSPLGDGVGALRFSLASSDNGSFGMNTPAFFAIDNVIAVPEPGATALLLGVLATLGNARPRRGGSR
jgi:hypothetical protein